MDDLRAKKLVWHYTTLESLQLILQSGALLATEVSYQNDPREPETAVEAIEEALHELGKDAIYASFSRDALYWNRQLRENAGFLGGRVGELVNSSRFIFCASTDPDSLYAWRTYSAASRTGCAIGLDPDWPLGMIGDSAEGRSVNIAQWSEVIYDSTRLLQFSIDRLRAVGDAWNRESLRDDEWVAEQEAKGIPDHLVERNSYPFGILVLDLPKALAEITAVAKHGSFQDERETRVTVSDAAFGVVFTPGANGPRPRVRLAASPQWGDVMGAPTGRLPIRALVLAPDAGREALVTAQWLLYANKYPLDPLPEIDEDGPEPVMYFDDSQTVGIFRSAHPYRRV